MRHRIATQLLRMPQTEADEDTLDPNTHCTICRKPHSKCRCMT